MVDEKLVALLTFVYCSLRLLPARQTVLKGICSVIQGYWGDDAQALLYGSCATGLDTEDSDVDIVISFIKNNRSLLLDAVTVAHKIDEVRACLERNTRLLTPTPPTFLTS